MGKNKVCIFVYDWVARPIKEEEIFPNKDNNTIYKYYLMSRLSNDQKRDLPIEYKNNGWEVSVKNVSR
jgi:hypothetical protein